MNKFNRKTLLELLRRYAESEIPPKFEEIDGRTLQFYHTEGLLDETEKRGRESFYSERHFKQLIGLRILQTLKTPLALIRKKIQDPKAVLELYGGDRFQEEQIDAFIKTNKIEPEAEAEAPQNSGPSAQKEEPMLVAPAVATPRPQHLANDRITCSVENYQVFANLQQKAKVGAAFVFINDLDEPTGILLHRLIHGQKSKRTKAIKRAVIYADEDGFNLPGCTVFGSKIERDLALVVADKDVYREAEDTARFFIYDPSSSGLEKIANVFCNDAQIESLKVKLDSNGCGLVRYTPYAAGQYEVQIEGSAAKCNFEAARYALAPMTATLASFRKVGEEFAAHVHAYSFGQPFSGPATIGIIVGGSQIDKKDVEFKEGAASITFQPSGDQGIALRVTSKNDPDLISNVPLRGSSKTQREETQISGLGRIRTISLVNSEGATEQRGIHVSEGGIANSPIALDSCVSNKIELTFKSDIEDLVLVVREPVLGATNVYEIGSVKKDKTYKVEFESAVASIYLGAFVEGKAWEGHAIVIKPSKAQISIHAPEKLSPGERLKIKLKVKQKSSVLLRVADKRMRVQEDAKTATASAYKRWIAAAAKTAVNGEVSGQLSYDQPMMATATSARRSVGAGGASAGGMVFGASLESMGGQHVNTMRSMRHSMIAESDSNRMMLSAGITRDASKSARVRSLVPMGGIESVENLIDDSDEEVPNATAAMIEAPTAPSIDARETEADLIYCGLIEVGKEELIEIDLPQCIAEYDITAFAISKGDTVEAQHDLSVSKDAYIEPMIPQFAHPEDGVQAVVVGVRAPKTKKYRVTIDGKDIAALVTQEGENTRVSYPATPGIHDVVMLDDNDVEIDRVIRVVECPGEETVLAQELRILRSGDEYKLEEDSGALSIRVLPGMQNEFKIAVQVCTDFSHSCCEQTSAKVVAACLAAMTAQTESEKEKAYLSIVNGEARLRSMYVKDQGFRSYPGGDFYQNWSSAAARRVSQLSMVTEGTKLPADATRAIKSMVEMGENVLKAHGDVYNNGKTGEHTDQPMEANYYRRHTRQITGAEIDSMIANLKNSNVWNYMVKSEACFCAAALVRDKRLGEGIRVCNEVAKLIGGAMGGAMHGSYETLAYMHMIDELRKAGIVPGTKGKIKVNGKETTIEKALGREDIREISATKGAVAVRITRLNKIDFAKSNIDCQISIDLLDKNKKSVLNGQIKAGSQVMLVVKINGGNGPSNLKVNGDVVCAALPDCLSRIVAGTKQKKFQIDFTGSNEVSVDLVAGRATEKPQRWAAVIRNMYDEKRIGSVGLLTAQVK